MSYQQLRYLLDTNVCIRYINGRSLNLRQTLEATLRESVGASTITKAELYYGSAKSQTPERSREKQIEFLYTVTLMPFNNQASEVYGEMRATLERRGTPIGQNDMLIAAIALAYDLTLVTHNTREFGRIDGLKLEDWEV